MEIASTVYRQISREWSTKRNTLSPLCEGVPGAEVRKFPRRSWFPGRLDLADERKSSACHKSTQLCKKRACVQFYNNFGPKTEVVWAFLHIPGWRNSKITSEKSPSLQIVEKQVPKFWIPQSTSTDPLLQFMLLLILLLCSCSFMLIQTCC